MEEVADTLGRSRVAALTGESTCRDEGRGGSIGQTRPVAVKITATRRGVLPTRAETIVEHYLGAPCRRVEEVVRRHHIGNRNVTLRASVGGMGGASDVLGMASDAERRRRRSSQKVVGRCT